MTDVDRLMQSLALADVIRRELSAVTPADKRQSVDRRLARIPRLIREAAIWLQAPLPHKPPPVTLAPLNVMIAECAGFVVDALVQATEPNPVLIASLLEAFEYALARIPSQAVDARQSALPIGDA